MVKNEWIVRPRNEKVEELKGKMKRRRKTNLGRKRGRRMNDLEKGEGERNRERKKERFFLYFSLNGEKKRFLKIKETMSPFLSRARNEPNQFEYSS